MQEPILRIDLGFVNAYLLHAGDGYILIDTGIGEVWTQLESELLKRGCLPERLKLVILTHGDADHTGNALRLQQKYGINIAMHPGDVELVSTGKPQKRHSNSLIERFTIWLGSKITRTFDLFTPDVLLEDEQSLAPYGIDAQIIHTPGHTPGSVCILTANGELICGDTFVNRRKPSSAVIIENDQALKASLEKLGELKIRKILPGHGKPFTGEKLSKRSIP